MRSCKKPREVIREFFRILRRGGVLHLCAPYRLHPRHQAEVLDLNEAGGHVRAGYTEEEYRILLEPVGFRINTVVGIGPPAVVRAEEFLHPIRSHVGDWLALPFVPVALALVWSAKFNPTVPFSLYVRAVKPGDARGTLLVGNGGDVPLRNYEFRHNHMQSIRLAT